MPAAPGAKVLTQIGRETAAANVGGRILAGLRDANSAYIDPSKVGSFLDSKAGLSVMKRIAKVKSVEEAMAIFPTADAKFWKGVVEVQDVAQTRKFLDDTLGLGDINRGIGPKNVADINISRWDDVKRNMPYFGTQKESKVARLMADLSGRGVIVAGGSDREIARSIKNVRDYLIQARVPKSLRNDLVNRLTDAFVLGDGSVRNVVIEIEQASRASMRKFGVTDELNDILHDGLKKMKDVYDKDLYGAIDDIGGSADFGGTFTWIDEAGNVVTGGHPLMTAGIQSEMMKHAVMLPDPRRVRRIVSTLSPIQKITTKQALKKGAKYGELRVPFAVLEFIQNDLWRPMTLATGGYVLRNMSDSMLRQSFAPGIQTGLFHPLELILVALYKKFKGDIWGLSFNGDPEDLIRMGQREMAEAVNGSLREIDPAKRAAREFRTGVWRRVKRGDGIEEFSKAVAAEVGLLHTDELVKLVAEGKSTDEILDWMTNTPAGRKHLDQIQNMWKNRTIPTQGGGKTVGTVVFKNADGSINRVNVEQYIEKYLKPRIDATTGKDALLREVIATGKFTDQYGNTVDAFKMSRTGEITGYSDEFLREINGIVDNPNIALKETYKSQVTVSDLRAQGKLAGAGSTLDNIVDKFFSELYPKREAFLNRSPVFRQEYYNVVGRLADELAPGEAARIVDNIAQAAKEAGETFNKRFFFRYVGNKKTAKTLWDKAKGVLPSNGKLTFEDIDAYAKGAALDATKKLFYNAAERSNFSDVMRIIAPFGAAWAEVMGNWTRRLTTDPEAFKRGYTAVQGLRRADPDGDGRGFFYKDAVSGEYVFNYPMSNHLAALMYGTTGAVVGGIIGGPVGFLAGATGGAALGEAASQQLGGMPASDLVAPAKSLNMGFNIVPGVGPYVQWGASKIIGNKPQFDSWRKFLMPYGEPDVGVINAPKWFQKGFSAFFGDPENDRLLGDMTMQVMEALVMSGKYDLSTNQGIQKLQDDALGQARNLLMLRALGQFTGPTRPVPEVRVPLPEEKRQGTITIEGETIDLSKVDLYGQEMAKYFRQLQDENYDTAVLKFLETFGDDAFLYMAGKTRATVGGLDASKEFGQWERSNTGFFNTYEKVAGYFAPVGTKFDYQVYVRQIENGLRRNLTPEEMVLEAQRLVGASVYRTLVRSVGPKPTDEQKQILRETRDKLYEQYPGFAQATIPLRQFEAQIDVLYDAAFDSRMDDNPVATATREYLTVRDKANEIAAERGFTLKAGANADLRDILRAEGERLAVVYPDFARLWERLLLQEVDLGEGD